MHMYRIICLFYLLVPTLLSSQLTSTADSLDLENIIIASSRVSREAPYSFQNIDRAQIESIYIGQDPVTLLQRLAPSIISYSDGGTDIGNYSQFRLRGIDQDRLNISLNGVPLNDMVDHGTFFSNFSDFGNSVESIQIIRGTGANSVGAASYGGSVNFESPNLFKESSDHSVQLTAGSFGTLRTSAELSTGLMDQRYGVYARMTRTHSDGYKDNSGSDSYSLFFSTGIKGNDDVLKLTAFAGKTQNGQSYEHVPRSIIDIDPRTNFNNLNDVDDFEQNMVQLQYAKSSGSLDYVLTAYYSGAGGVFPFTFDGSQFMFGLENDQWGLQVGTTKTFKDMSLSFGVNAYTFDRTNFEFISPFVREPYFRDFTDKDEASVYLKWTKSTNGINLFANVELRHLDMNMTADETIIDPFNMSESYTFFNGSLGLSYDLNDYADIYLSYGETSREPTRSDLLNGVTESERVHDIELGYRYSSNKLKFAANLFYMNFDNEISKIGALVDRSYMEIRQNVPNSLRSGVEIEGSYDINSNIGFGLNLAYLNTSIDEYVDGANTFTDVEHIFAPKWTISPSIHWQITDQIVIDLNSLHVSQSFAELSNNQDFTLPAFTVLNAQLNMTVTDRLTLGVVVNNLFDVLYFTEGSPIDIEFDGIVDEMGFRVQPPRNFYVTLNYQF